MIELEFRDQIALITINRPQALNAISFQLLRDLNSRLDEVATSSARALIVTGAGTKSFCAGADIQELRDRSMQEERQGALFGQAVFSKLERLPLASIALVNGYAFGGGTELALSCTFRLATPNAKFGLPEIKLGLIPGYGGTQRLPRVIGSARALEMIMTGRTVAADEARDMGLVNQVLPASEGCVDQAIKFAQSFTGYGLRALQLAREAVQRAWDLPMSEGLNMEADLSTLAYSTADAKEGMRAFVEKRAAVFSNR